MPHNMEDAQRKLPITISEANNITRTNSSAQDNAYAWQAYIDKATRIHDAYSTRGAVEVCITATFFAGSLTAIALGLVTAQPALVAVGFKALIASAEIGGTVTLLDIVPNWLRYIHYENKAARTGRRLYNRTRRG